MDFSCVDSASEALQSDDAEDRRTPLDRTIDRIGMGRYQWILLSLCGFGYLADNMWMQANSIILPRVQRHFSVRDQVVGTMSSSMIGGMTLGALSWGACTDVMGRVSAFNATLFLTSIFGACASFADSFVALCIVWFLLGTAIGGSMPTDGTLMLEYMPSGKHHLVIATGAYCSLGALLAALAGLLILPGHSCPPLPAPCERSQNKGWKYLVFSLGVFTITMSVARMLLFRLYESPRFLVHRGRHDEAVDALQCISKFNGKELMLRAEDVSDNCLNEGNIPLDSLALPDEEGKAYVLLPTEEGGVSHQDSKDSPKSRLPKLFRTLIIRPLKSWVGRIQILLSRRWRKTTLLLWATNCAINLAFSMFNIFLPKLLEERSNSDGGQASLSGSLWGIVIYTLGGCPGSFLAAYMANTKLGRRWSLVGSTAVTAMLSIVFIFVRSPWAVNFTTAGINLISTTMWAVLYGWMPMLFSTEVRGTACGTAIALSRIAGMTAAVLGGLIISVSNVLAISVTVIMYIVAVILVLFMKEDGHE